MRTRTKKGVKNGSDNKLLNLLKGNIDCFLNYCRAEIVVRNHQYSHEKTRYVTLGVYGLDKEFYHLEQLLNSLEEDIEALRLELSKQLYKTLETEYNYLSSNESIIETIKANDYYFTEDGNLD